MTINAATNSTSSNVSTQQENSSTTGTSSTQTLQGSTIQAGGNVTVQSQGVTASNGNVTVQGAAVDVESQLNQSQSSIKTSGGSGGLLGGSSSSDSETAQTTLAQTALKGNNVNITSTTGDTALVGVQVSTATGGSVNISSAGNLNLGSVTTTDYASYQSQGSNVVMQSSQAKGHDIETVNYNKINSGNVSIGAVGQITADMSVKDVAATLAQQPGMGWIAQIQNNPALASKINWNQVQQSYQTWDYSAQGLTAAASIIVAIVVTAMTAGTASSAATDLVTDAGMTTTAGAFTGESVAP